MKHWVALLALLSQVACAADSAAGAPQEVAGRTSQELADSGSWHIEHEYLGGDRHRLHLQLNRLHTGDDGNARVLVRRWAENRLRAQGDAGYEMLRYEEGVRSGWFVGRRYAEAELRFYRSAAFGSF
ncbi:MAG: hypothetical protein KDH15_10285 [Rhodocyclaceae bacterium]|nr:hypothetical protein [Rhodocyclaceae bacterium]